MKAAFDIARDSAVFGRAQLTSVGLVNFRPVRQLVEYRLSGDGKACT